MRTEASEVRGRHSKDFFPKQWQKYLVDDLKVAKRGKPVVGIIEPFEPNGNEEERRVMRTDKYPLRNEKGEIYGVIVYCQDITNFIKRENDYFEELNNRKLKLAQMSHDLRIPLSGLPILLDALEQIDISKLSTENRNFISIARANAYITYQMMSNVLDNYSQDLPSAPIEEINFLDLVVDITATYAEQATQRLLTLLILSPSSGDSIMLTGNAPRLRRLLLKLIGMAIQFFKNAEVLLKVSNDVDKDGVGIEMDITHNDSHRSFKDGTSPSDFTEFLSCKAMIMEMGGTISSSAQPKEGKYFCSVFLPRVQKFVNSLLHVNCNK